MYYVDYVIHFHLEGGQKKVQRATHTTIRAATSSSCCWHSLPAFGKNTHNRRMPCTYYAVSTNDFTTGEHYTTTLLKCSLGCSCCLSSSLLFYPTQPQLTCTSSQGEGLPNKPTHQSPPPIYVFDFRGTSARHRKETDTTVTVSSSTHKGRQKKP